MVAARRVLFVMFMLAMLPAAASAQSIAGVVRDPSGAVLPGVTVEASSPALIEKVRSVSTDGTGQYKIENLRPGVYTVTFTLTGFSTARREGVEIAGTFVATINGEMRVGSVAETVTVTGEAPIVDVQSASRQRVFGQDVLEAIPAGRSHINEVVFIPGVAAAQPGRGALADVGGTNNLQNTTFSIHGGRTSDTRLQLDGVRLGNVLSPGEFSNFVPDTGATQEVAVDYAAISAEQAFGGLRINLVPKEGGNSFRGSVFATGVNAAWQTSNLSQELIDKGLPQPNEMKRAYDINPSFGGPVIREKLWFFSSARWQQNQNYVAGLFANANAGDPTKWLYQADPSQRGQFSITQNGVNTRLTYQAAQKHKISFYYDNQTRDWDDSRAGVSPESTVLYRFPVLRLAQASYTSPLTSKLLLEVRYANRGESFGNQLPAEGDIWRKLIPVFDQSRAFQYRGRGGDGGVTGTFGYSEQNINTAVVNVSYVTGAHSFKAGFSDTWSQTLSSSNSNDSNLYFRFATDPVTGITAPNQLTMYGTPTTGASKVLGEIGIFAQDRWTHKRLTATAGIRYDQFRGGYPEQHLGPALFQPTRDLTFAAVTGIDLRDVTPRLGVGYDVFGNGKTAVKVNLGKYTIGVSNIGNPAGITNTVTRTWTDANGNFAPDCNLLNLQAQDLRSSGGDFCSTVSSLNFGLPTSVTKFNNDTRFGWGNRAYNWEFSTSIQHQIVPRVAVDVGYFRRWFGNFQTTQNLLTASSDYSPFSFTAPLDPRLPGGGGYLVSDLFDLNPNRVGQTDNYTTLSSDFGSQIEHWNGVDASVNARLEHGIMIQGGVSVGKTITDSCEIRANSSGNPSQRFCHVESNLMGQTQVKMIGSYMVPKADVSIAAVFQSTPGPSLSANYLAPNALVQPSLGRPLSNSATNVTVNLIAPNTLYGDRANQVDIRFSKIFKFASRRANLNLDLYNLLNANPVMQENSAFQVWRTPQRIMDARLFKLSAQFEF
ncbi:MAG: carboxypeptidase regulatory-like domain-containing protein [Acidobacteriota bacterium]